MKRTKSSLLPRFSLNRPVTVTTSLFALLVVGFIAFNQIAVELLPAGFTPPFLGIWAPYPNSNPQEVEEQIAKKIEEAVQTIPGVRRVQSNSSSSGCWTFIEFAQGTDMDLAYAQLRDRAERVKPELPDDIERLYLRKWNEDDDPVVWITLALQQPHDDPYLLVEQHIQKPLERVDGVAKVEIWGAYEKSILIYVNQDRVKSYKINLYNVIQQLRNDNFALSSGYVKEGGRKIYVRSLGKFRTLEEVENIPIRGTNLRLKDVAEVRYDVPERRWRMTQDGKEAISLGIFKESTANTVQVCEEVLSAFDGRIKTDPKLSIFKFDLLFSQGEFIRESIDNLIKTALWGGLFAFLVLYFFLRRFRMTVIVTTAIPLATVITLTAMYFIGWTLNVITMMGLMISIGMVVDNSIVVLENIYRKKKELKDNTEAALQGTSEVGLAITLATLTTVVVFLPLILMNDEIGFRFYMLRIGLPVMISLLASLLVAMVFIPLAASKIASSREVKEARVISSSNRLYQRVLRWIISRRVETFVILLLVLASTAFAIKNVKQNPNMQGNINDVILFFELPENYTMEDAQRLFAAIEDTVKKKEKVYGVRTINSRYRHNWGMMRVFLYPPERKDWYEILYDGIRNKIVPDTNAVMTREAVAEDLKKRLPETPGVTIRTTWRRTGGGDDASISIELFGDDTNTLAELAKEVERRLRSIEEIVSVETDREKGSDEIHLMIKREQAKKYGISPAMISGTVQYALRGIPLPRYHTSEKEIDVHIQLREEDRRNLAQLKNITFFTNSGKEIPLDAVASFTVKRGFGEIRRENGKTYLRVKAVSTDDNIKGLFGKVYAAMQGFEMPFGYSWGFGRALRDLEESNNSQKFALILSGTFVFLLMGVLFESFVLPLSVILSIPLAFVGAYWLMFITGTAVDLMSQIGFVILVGVVVNNAIVLIDLVNRLRFEGYSRSEAIMEAGKQRFRPILMTAFTTIGGLLPMAIGGAQMIGISYAPMGRTIIGGLLTSTMLSLLAVPWAYTLFDDMRIYFKRIAALYLARAESAATTAGRIEEA